MRKIVSLLALLSMLSLSTPIVHADSTATLTVTPGPFNFTGPTMNATANTTLTGAVQTAFSSIGTITINDITGDAAGFHVTAQGTQFTEVAPGTGFAQGTNPLTLPFDSMKYSPSVVSVSATPDDCSGGSLVVQNPGFESGTANWTFSGRIPTISTTNYHSGLQSLQFSASITKTLRSTGSAMSGNITVSPGQTICLSSWITTTTGNASGLGQVELHFYQGTTQLGVVTSGIKSHSSWTQDSVTAVVPQGADHVQAWLTFTTSSTLTTSTLVYTYFDDVALTVYPGGGPLPVTSVNIDDPTPQTILSASQNQGLGTYQLGVNGSANQVTITLNPATTYVDTVNYPTAATPFQSTITWTLASGP